MIATVSAPGSLISISVSTLVPDRVVGFRMYLQDADDGPLRLYCSEDIPFEASHLKNLQRSGRHSVLISAADHERYQQYLRDNLTTILNDERYVVRERLATLNLVVRDVLAEAFEQGRRQAPQVEKMRELAATSVEMLSRDDYVARDLLGVLHHDYQTFTHSTGVAFHCVVLAKALGISNPDTLRDIALGGFLHDLGKLEIPERILNKPDRLTPQEFDVVRQHPRTGFERLAMRDDVSRAQLMMVYQHHERVDGGGYPVGCMRHELHDWARICTVVDVFEALTSDRPYRHRLPLRQIVKIMDRGAGKKFDEDMLKCWKNTIAGNGTDS